VHQLKYQRVFAGFAAIWITTQAPLPFSCPLPTTRHTPGPVGCVSWPGARSPISVMRYAASSGARLFLSVAVCECRYRIHSTEHSVRDRESHSTERREPRARASRRLRGHKRPSSIQQPTMRARTSWAVSVLRGRSRDVTAFSPSPRACEYATGYSGSSAVCARDNWGWRVGVGQLGSGCLPVVPVMKSADLRDRHDATLNQRGDRARDRRVLFQRHVSA
jgi:hypothetical protein